MRKALICLTFTLSLVYSSCATPTVKDRLLLEAVGSGNVEKASEALRDGARINFRSTSEEFYQYTPLMMAAWNGDTEISKLLIDSGADIDAKTNNNGTAVFWASFNDHVSVVQLLVTAGANPNISLKDAGPFTGYTPLTLACVLNHVEVVELLVKNNANLEIEDASGGTALTWASFYGFTEIEKLLLDAGADTTATKMLDDITFESSYVIVDKSASAYLLFYGIPDEETLESVKSEIPAGIDLDIYSWSEFIQSSFELVDGFVIYDDYGFPILVHGIISFLVWYPLQEISVTWNSGIAFTTRDYIRAEEYYKSYIEDANEYHQTKIPFDYTHDPMGHFQGLLGW